MILVATVVMVFKHCPLRRYPGSFQELNQLERTAVQWLSELDISPWIYLFVYFWYIKCFKLFVYKYYKFCTLFYILYFVLPFISHPLCLPILLDLLYLLSYETNKKLIVFSYNSLVLILLSFYIFRL